MNALVKKEIRALLPAWIAALALVTLPELLVWIATQHKATPPDPVLFWLFGFGVLLIGLASFGQEFSSGTFSILLAQPIPRVRIWRTKINVLATALLSVSLIFLIVFWSEPVVLEPHDAGLLKYSFLICALIVTCATSGALWTTLLLRQIASAFWITILAPWPVSVIVLLTTPEDFQPTVIAIALAIYSVIGFFVARRIFLNAQDVQWTGGTIPFPSLRRAKAFSEIRPRATGQKPLRALIWKEIQFQHVSLMLAIAIFVLHIAIILARKMNPALPEPGKVTAALFVLWFILWFALPFLIGSQAVAEERRLGTLENHLCLPVTRRAQFATKFFVAVALSVLICAGMPWLIEGTGILSGVHSISPFDVFFAPKDLGILSAIAAGIAAFSFFASTLTRNTLQAMGVSVIVNIFAVWMILWCMHPPMMFMGARAGYGPLFGCIGGPLLAITLCGLALENYKRAVVDFKVWRRNVLVLAATFFFSWTATALVYNRSWEWVMNLEPPHGPARLSGPVKPRIFQSWAKTYALLPDGRLWVSKNQRRQVLYTYRQLDKTEEVAALIPVDGEFIGSNWVCVASHYNFPVGIQSDGSLWKIFLYPHRTNYAAIPKLERIGSDSDWKTVVSGSGFYLALKNNGSLWGWENNSEGQLGPGPQMFTNGPVRIGEDSDWVNVFATGQVSIGVKRDGSIWKWGGVQFGPDGTFYGGGQQSHPNPIRWNGNGSDWMERAGFYPPCDVVLRRDGTIWATGILPQNLLGHSFRNETTTNWLQIGSESDWTEIGFDGNQFDALKKKGTFVENDISRLTFFGGATWHPSKHSDWIAVAPSWSEMTLALAADGTLSCWFRAPEGNGDEQRNLLGPTRKPLWNLNILDATK